MKVIVSKNDSLEIFDKLVAYLDKKFPDYSKRLDIENDAAVYVYEKGNNKIKAINDCFIDVNKVESNFDFEIPKFE